MMSVHELCSATGVTRKALYYYDQIDLLKPAVRSGTQKAKLYGEKEVERLNRILHYQEAGLSLNEIRIILNGTKEEQKEVLQTVIQRLSAEEEALQKKIENAKAFLKELES